MIDAAGNRVHRAGLIRLALALIMRCAFRLQLLAVFVADIAEIGRALPVLPTISAIIA